MAWQVLRSSGHWRKLAVDSECFSAGHAKILTNSGSLAEGRHIVASDGSVIDRLQRVALDARQGVVIPAAILLAGKSRSTQQRRL